jgi:uncharacterized membrane protein
MTDRASSRQFPSLAEVGKQPGEWRNIAIGTAISCSIVLIGLWQFLPELWTWLQQAQVRPRLPDFSRIAGLPLAVQIHLVGAIGALGLGPVVLWRRKGDAAHRLLGRVWVGAMMLTCASSFFMTSFAPMLGMFGPIHVLSVWTLYSLPRAILAARRGEIDRHRAIMRGLWFGLLFAGALTFIPGRTIFWLFFGTTGG